MADESSLAIRPYIDADHAEVVKLNQYGLAAAGVREGADIYAGDLDAVAETYLTGRNALLVGEIADAVVAMGALREIDTKTCEILRMRVNPQHQGDGHGRAILQALENRAAQLGYQQAVLVTGPDQHPAIDLYLSAGYRRTGIERHGELIGVRMLKPIPRGN